MSLDHTISLIEANITAAKQHFQQIEAARFLLQEQGMYPAVPHFQWQRREEMGEAKYLYLIFRQNSDGSHQGPDGKKKVYVGADPAKIEEAKRLVINRAQWEQLGREASKLRGWIDYYKSEIAELNREANRILVRSQEWPKASIPTHQANGVTV